MNPKALNLFLEANGFTVTGNTDKYYRLSTNGIGKEVGAHGNDNNKLGKWEKW